MQSAATIVTCHEETASDAQLCQDVRASSSSCADAVLAGTRVDERECAFSPRTQHQQPFAGILHDVSWVSMQSEGSSAAVSGDSSPGAEEQSEHAGAGLDDNAEEAHVEAEVVSRPLLRPSDHKEDPSAAVHIECLAQMECFLRQNLSSKGLISNDIGRLAKTSQSQSSLKTIQGQRGLTRSMAACDSPTESHGAAHCQQANSLSIEDEALVQHYFAPCNISGTDLRARLARRIRKVEHLYQVYAASEGLCVLDEQMACVTFPQHHVQKLASRVLSSLEKRHGCAKKGQQAESSSHSNLTTRNPDHHSKFSSHEKESFSKIVWRTAPVQDRASAADNVKQSHHSKTCPVITYRGGNLTTQSS